MNLAKTSLVSPNEFSMLGNSMMTVIADLQNRATKLQGQQSILPTDCPSLTLPDSCLQASEPEQQGEAGESILRNCECPNMVLQ